MLTDDEVIELFSINAYTMRAVFEQVYGYKTGGDLFELAANKVKENDAAQVARYVHQLFMDADEKLPVVHSVVWDVVTMLADHHAVDTSAVVVDSSTVVVASEAIEEGNEDEDADSNTDEED